MQQLRSFHLLIDSSTAAGQTEMHSLIESYIDLPNQTWYTVVTDTRGYSPNVPPGISKYLTIGAAQYSKIANAQLWELGEANDRPFNTVVYLSQSGLLPNKESKMSYSREGSELISGIACDIYRTGATTLVGGSFGFAFGYRYWVGRQDNIIYQAEYTSASEAGDRRHTTVTFSQRVMPIRIGAPDAALVQPTPTAAPTVVTLAQLQDWTLAAYSDPRRSSLHGIVALTPAEVWAVGDTDPVSSAGHALVERWIGDHWSIVPNPALSGSALAAISGRDSADLWAVGFYFADDGKRQTLVEHWNGGAWEIVPSPNVAAVENELYGVAAIAADDVWAVGDSYLPRRALAMHWDGQQWTLIPVADGETFWAVSGTATDDVWAVGQSTTPSDQTLIQHWDGTRWRTVPSPNPDEDCALRAIASKEGTAWAVGGCKEHTLIEHWDGTAWSVIPSQDRPGGYNILNGVAIQAPNDVWAVGYAGGGTLVEHWDGREWQILNSPNITSPDGSLAQNQLLAAATIAGGDLWVAGVVLPPTSRTIGRYRGR